MICRILEDIEASLKQNFEEVYLSLRPGITESELNSFADRCLAGRSIPSDLADLYRWHNGQNSNFSLNQNDNRTFLPIEDAIDAWEFLNDPMQDILQPISKDWIPFAYNGAGDYLMYDLSSGSVLCYWHDDVDRPLESKNLTDWLSAVLAAAKP